MARKKAAGGGEDSGTWLNTYADMVTLLLTFFAVLLSMSSVNEEKFNALMESLQAKRPDIVAAPVVNGSASSNEDSGSIGDMTELYESIVDYVKKNGMEDAVQVELKDDVLYIRFSSSMIFEADKYKLKANSTQTLDMIANALVLFQSNIKMLNIYGHTAKVENPKTYDVSSWMLSCERAGAVANFLVNGKGFDPSKVVAVGYGYTRPVADNNTSAGRELNRRVELMIIGNSSDIEDGVYDQLNEFFDPSMYPTKGGVDDVYGLEGTTPPTSTEAGPSIIPPEPLPDSIQTGVSPYTD